MENLEQAKASELVDCCRILDEGRAFQKEQGFVQWTDRYPNAETIRDDIQTGKGYVVKVDGRIAGYMCIDFDGEPVYGSLRGEWRASVPYAVVHRMAFGKEFRGRGLADATFRLIGELCLSKRIGYIRIDTNVRNARMQHVLEKNGFVKCGTLVFQGSDNVAYDKILK